MKGTQKKPVLTGMVPLERKEDFFAILVMDKPHDPGEMMCRRFIECRFITSPGKKDTETEYERRI